MAETCHTEQIQQPPIRPGAAAVPRRVHPFKLEIRFQRCLEIDF